MKTKEETLNRFCAILLLIVIMLTNFWVVGETAISYAIDMAKTSSSNIQISAYFLDENKVETENKEKSIGSEEESLYIKIGVKQEGYFNGKINLENPNFAINREFIDEGVSEITSDGEIILKQINAGTDKVIELKIKPLEDMKIEDLKRVTTIKVEGDYRDSKNVVKEEAEHIEGKTTISLHWVSSKNSKMILSAEVFNNKIYNFGGENKRLVQILVKSRISNNHYPVKSTEIKLDKLENVEDIKVEEKGEEVSYTEEEGKIVINREKTEETKYEEQELVVTYTLRENVGTINKEIKVEGKMEAYDGKELTSEKVISTGEEKEGTISYEVESEKEIYKGKLLIGEAKEYKTNIKIKVNYVGLTDKIKLIGEKSTYSIGEKEGEAKNIYKETKINKKQMLEILGENGYLRILDPKGIAIYTVSKNSKEDEEGFVVINYPRNFERIEIETSKPEKTGEIEIENTKEIQDIGYSREEKNSFTHINEKIIGNLGENITTKIELKNTVTEAELEVSTDTLSTIEENKNVKMTIKLLNNDETKDLYQNPRIKVKLPEEVKEVTARCKLLYGNGLELGESKIVKEENGELGLEMGLKGTQSTYNAEAVEGTTIIITANMKLDELAGSGESKIGLEYENELATSYVGEKEVPIDIEAKVGVIATNGIEELNASSIGEENKKVKLNVSKEAKNATVQINVINNEMTKIKDVKILGKFPTKESDNLGVTLTSGIIVNNANVKIYYSDKENVTNRLEDKSNNWSEDFNPNTAKNYLIVPKNNEDMETRTRLTASYGINIPEDLDYNMKATESYSVTYLKEGYDKVNKVQATQFELITGEGPDIDVSIKAIVGNDIVGVGSNAKQETGTQVTSGEIIKYEVTLTNNGTCPATNVEVVENVPENTMPVEYEKIEELDEYEFLPSTNTSKKIEQIEIGETKIVEFYLRPITLEDAVISNEFEINYNDKTEKSYVTNAVKGNGYKISLIANSESSEVLEGKTYLYKLTIGDVWDEIRMLNDKSDEEEDLEPNPIMENVKVSVKEQQLFSVRYIKVKGETFYDTNEIDIDELYENEEIIICLKTIEHVTDNNLAEICVDVTCGTPDLKFRSNKITRIIKRTNLDINIEANNVGEEVNISQEINYKITITNANGNADIKDAVIEDIIFSGLDVTEVLMNGRPLSEDDYTIASKYNDVKNDGEDEETEVTKEIDPLKDVLTINAGINSGETKIIEVKCKVSSSIRSLIKEKTEITNNVIVTTDTGKKIESKEIIHIIDPETQRYEGGNNKNDYGDERPSTPPSSNTPSNPDDLDNPTNPDMPNNSDNPNKENKTYAISGTAWFDEDENGIKDGEEQRLGGITVKLMNLDTNETKTAITSNSGFYAFTGLVNGKYVVMFEYNTEKYMLTAYQAEGAGSNENSDAENVTMKIEGTDKKVSSTDTLEIRNNSITDIDIGLVLARKFDLELVKTISKVSVINDEGTETTNYNGVTYAKAEIHAKHIEESTIVVEYKIKVTNTGELPGYVKSIVDYKPVDMFFDSTLNIGWYQEGDSLYSNSLADVKLEAGESKELTLVLTKQMTENNMGLVNNLAEIAEADTTLGIKDIDSTYGNKVRGEDDLGSSDLSIGIKTGTVVSYTVFTISSIVILIVCAYLINYNLLKRKKI